MMMINITSYQEIANQNNNELTSLPVRKSSIKKKEKITNAGNDVEKGKLLHTVDSNANEHSHYSKQWADFIKQNCLMTQQSYC